MGRPTAQYNEKISRFLTNDNRVKLTTSEITKYAIDKVTDHNSLMSSFQETPLSILTQKRKRKDYVKKSIVHNHSILINERNESVRKFNYCLVTYSSKSTTRMKNHLENEHHIKNEDESDVDEPDAKKIIGIFHQSSIIQEILGEKQSIANVCKHNLVQDVQTMWNSTFLILERLQEQAEVVNETLIDRRSQKK
ncbi:unnamed protein product [Brachionus calyciflorus]|uniref:BED-type domain-containing protein n=1 Tax=Brachionus calyciflorus TaxID=104777 RepID=A0A814M4E4_9BILA|nr:unnamed protein product [Brachionus calyciflorus]